MDKKRLKTTIYSVYSKSKNYIFPLALVLFAIIKVNKGIDLTDTTYSLGNYQFFTESDGVWFLLTFFSNIVGYIMTLLPFGGTMLGMKIYTSLIIALMGCLGFRFFRTKMPSWLAFLAEILAIGMCWAPSTILYHYLTYFFFLLGCILIFRGLAGKKDRCLYLAGICLGVNVFVRFPGNILEVLLIFALWYYCFVEGKTFEETMKKTGLCVAGFFSAVIIMIIFVSMVYGTDAMGRMIQGVLGISGSASDYTFTQMLVAILDSYWHGFKWGLYLIIATIMGIPFFLLYDQKYLRLRKLVYCICILFLFAVLERWGMYNFKYYQKESALQWGAMFLILSIGICVWIFITRQMNNDWKLIGAMSLIVILITPLGSNNYIWPVLNNLFFVAPVSFWVIYRFARWGRKYLDESKKVPLFALKAMSAALIIAFLIQSVGVGLFYVFIDGEDGYPRNSRVESNSVLAGMKTNEALADNLSSISEYFDSKESEFGGRRLILYGNIPGLAYFLNRPSALNTTWSDLDSNPVEDMQKAIDKIDVSKLEQRPIVILSREIYESPDNSVKLNLVTSFIDNNGYDQTFSNDYFVVWE